MRKEDDSVVFHARASPSGFIVFGVLYAPICILYLVLLAKGKLHGQALAVFVPWLLLIPTYVWLLGFRIRITMDRFEYRDGLWRLHSCPRNLVRSCKVRWLEFRNLGRVLQFPRLVIQCNGGSDDRIVINPKPFSREAIKRVKEILGGDKAAEFQNE